MKKTFRILVFLALVSPAFGQNSNFVHDMEFALHIHDTASVFESEIQAVREFEKVASKYPNEWLPRYWTAYLYTQIGRLVDRLKRGENPMDFINRAQESFDLSSRLLPQKTAENKSDFHALQTLIYLFRELFSDSTAQKEYRLLQAEELNLAIKENPDNPVAHVIVGTNLIREAVNPNTKAENTSTNLGKILAGTLLLKEARKHFENSRPERSMTTHWNQEWLPFWIPYGEKLLNNDQSAAR